jgi:hypothetical protein
MEYIFAVENGIRFWRQIYLSFLVLISYLAWVPVAVSKC